MSPIQTCFANNLKILRKSNGLTQEELAEAIEMTSTHIAHLETRRSWPSLETIRLLSKALGVDERALFRESDSPLIVELLAVLPALEQAQLESLLGTAKLFRQVNTLLRSKSGNLADKDR